MHAVIKKIMNFVCLVIMVVCAVPGCGVPAHETAPSAPPTSGGMTIPPHSADRFFLSPFEGWLAEYEVIGVHQQHMRLFKTGDGGFTRTLVAVTSNPGSTLPGGIQSGYVFLDSGSAIFNRVYSFGPTVMRRAAKTGCWRTS